jgi:hypothetical protein
MEQSLDVVHYDDLFFRIIVDSYVANSRFVRRDWLAEEIEAQLQHPQCRFVLLTAEPGAGKSAFLCQLAKDNPTWPVYFFRRDQCSPFSDVGAHSVLLRIGYQLAVHHPELFEPDRIRISVEQRVGTVEKSGELVGAEVNRVVQSTCW